MMISTNNFFAIQTNKESREAIVQIETVITKGLYRFTLLGMQVRYASDAKDRVYAALRSSDLLNLKSDNRKIIINLTPDNTDKHEGIYDLGIALSLLSCIDKKLPDIQILALGGLSLTGKITASKRLKQAIYTAYIQNIQYIACSQEDLDYLDIKLAEKLQTFGIFIIADSSLKGIVAKLKKLPAPNPIYETSGVTKKKARIPVKIPSKFNFSKQNELSRALILALGGGHNILIQSSFTRNIKEICEHIVETEVNTSFGHGLFSAFLEKTLDNEQKIDTIYVENIKNHNAKDFDLTHTGFKKCILAMYTPCSCGYQYSFFDSNDLHKRCICTKRTVLQHRRYIESTYFSIFSMHIINTEPQIHHSLDIIDKVLSLRAYQFQRYCNQHNLTDRQIFLFPDNSFTNNENETKNLEQLLDPEAKSLYHEHSHHNKILQLTQTIQDCLDMEQGNTNKKPVLSKQALILALSYMPRMDF